jgi:hypothetical protein
VLARCCLDLQNKALSANSGDWATNLTVHYATAAKCALNACT